MKLKYLFALPILATALIGCDEIEVSDAKPVENPQLPGITVDDFSVSTSSTLSGVMNLAALQDETSDPETEMLELYTISVLTEDLPESAVLSGGLQLSPTPDFEKVYNVGNVTVTDGVAYAPLSSFLYTRSTMFGKDPRPYEVYYRIPVYVTLNGGQYKIGDKDSYFCTGNSFTQEGVDPGYTVEEAYYLVGPNGNTAETAVKFTHSEYNIYDDAVFTVTAKFEEGFSSWSVAPLSVYEAANGGTPDASKCYGPSTATALEGTLELGKTGTLESGKKYEIRINLSELSYTVKEIADFDNLYTPGDSNGWDQETSQKLFTTDYETYTGFAYLSGGFKFTSTPDWNGLIFGGGSAEGELVSPGDNINAENGLYWCEVNINAMTYALTPITAIGIIGDFNGWGGDVEMTPSDNFLTWTATLTLTEAGGWKFRMNNDWAINLGGAEDNLGLNGDNINSAPGTYTVTLNLSKLPYSCTVVAQ